MPLTNENRELPVGVSKTVNDQSRLSTLRGKIEKSFEPDIDFDMLTQLAANAFDAPVSLISLVEEDIQWFRSCVGLQEKETEVQISFCAHAISCDELEPFLVMDATKDPRFAGNRLVIYDPYIRFYAGFPIVVGEQKVGTLCVIDNAPRRTVSDSQLLHLENLAALASSLFELKFKEQDSLKTRQKLAERELLNILANNTTSMSNWLLNLQTDMLECDGAMLRQLGVEEFKPLSKEAFLNLIAPDSRENARSYFEKLAAGQSDIEEEFKLADGERWFKIRGRNSIDVNTGQTGAVIGVFLETTDLKRSSENTKTLLKELDHRVKNTLAIMQSLSTQTLRGSSSGKEYSTVFFGRLQAISIVHGLLSESSWNGIDLKTAVKSQLESLVAEGHLFSFDLPEVTLTPDQALGLGLIIHELQKNALQHGSLNSQNGWVAISGDVQPGHQKQLTLCWREQGRRVSGEPDSFNAQTGLKLVARSLDKVLGSQVNICNDPQGFRVEISFPLQAS